MYSYITASSSLTNSTLESFDTNIDGSIDETTTKNFQFVIENGLYSIREGSEVIADEIFDFFSGLNENKQRTPYKVIISLAIVFICIS